MQTVLELLDERADEIRGVLHQLALECGELRDNGSRRQAGLIGFPTHSWDELDVDGRRLQSRGRRLFAAFVELTSALLDELPGDDRYEFEESKDRVTELLERRDTWSTTKEEALRSASEELDACLARIADLDDGSAGSSIFVPDTNALLFNPDLDRWRIEEVPFTVLLTPTVLSELDELKVRSRPELSGKVDGVISRIKGYRQRGGGDLRTGVTLSKGVSTLRSIAPEPRMDRSLPWLDPSSRDDRLIATVVEVMRTHVRSAVVLVTMDLNAQNKAAHAAIPYVQPPSP